MKIIAKFCCFIGILCLIPNGSTGKTETKQLVRVVKARRSYYQRCPAIYITIAKVESIYGNHCALPSSNDLFAEDTETKQIVRERGVLKLGSTYNYRCPPKHILIGAEFDICDGGKLLSELYSKSPICSKYCNSEAVNRISTTAVCIYKNQTVNCDDYIKPGTTVEIRCRFGYDSPMTNSITCLDSGDWDNVRFRCVPECGIIPANEKPFIRGGYHMPITNVPWQAAIYRKNEIGRFEHICGGSIITAKLVVTAAHCLWDFTLRKKKDKSLFTVAVGKTKRDYYTEDTDFSPQFSDILEYEVSSFFSGDYLSYISDVAVLVLEKPISFKKFISPICLERQVSGNKDIESNVTGRIAGWGIEETEKPSPYLKLIELPSISTIDCQSLVNVDYKSSVTADKFCVSSDQQLNSICEGDSGGGFAVERDSRYFLEGVVSTGLKYPGKTCADFFYTTFTSIRYHVQFIGDLEKKYIVY